MDVRGTLRSVGRVIGVLAAVLTTGIGGPGTAAAANCPCLPDIAIEQVCRVGGTITTDGDTKYLNKFLLEVTVVNRGNEANPVGNGAYLTSSLREVTPTASTNGAAATNAVALAPGQRLTIMLVPFLQRFPADTKAVLTVHALKAYHPIEEFDDANNRATFTVRGLPEC